MPPLASRPYSVGVDMDGGNDDQIEFLARLASSRKKNSIIRRARKLELPTQARNKEELTVVESTKKARDDWLAEVARDEEELLRTIRKRKENVMGKQRLVAVVSTPQSPTASSDGGMHDENAFEQTGYTTSSTTFFDPDDATGPSTSRTLTFPDQSTLADVSPIPVQSKSVSFSLPEALSPIPVQQESRILSRSGTESSHDSNGQRLRSRSVSFSEASLALTKSPEVELAQLRKRVVELEYKEAEALERFEERMRLQAETEIKMAKEITALSSRIETLQDDLESSTQSAVRNREERAWAEEKAVKLEASCAVLEARLDASARRQVALEAMLASVEESKAYALPVVQITQKPQIDPEVQEHLERKVKHLEEKLKEASTLQARLTIEMTEAKDDREKCEWARVASDKRAQDLENRLDHAKLQCKGLQERVSLLSSTAEELEKEKQYVELENTELIKEVGQLKKSLVAQNARVEQSEANHATRKLLFILDGCATDFEALLSIAESKLEGTIADLDVLLGISKDNADCRNEAEPSVLLRRFSSLAQRTKQVKESVIEDMAKQRASSASSSRATRSGGVPRARDPVPEARCGVQ